MGPQCVDHAVVVRRGGEGGGLGKIVLLPND